MSLVLTGSADHAMLALAISEARQAADQTDWWVGRTAVQKIMYFLQVTGVPMTYRFSIHHYGPFCGEILRDTEWLIADGVIADQSITQEQYSSYAPGSSLDDLLSMHRDLVAKWRPVVQNVVKALVPLRPERMEEIATLDYVFRQEKAVTEGAPNKDSVVERFMQAKRDKFPRNEVEKLYDAMSAAGLLRA